MDKYEPETPSPARKKASYLSLGFSEIEKVLGLALPERAYATTKWWDNDAGHSHAKGWLDAGWQTAAVDLQARQVTFELRPEGTWMPNRNRFGGMAGTISIMPGVDLTAPGDEVWNAEAGILFVE
jgi:hypothetical protein